MTSASPSPYVVLATKYRPQRFEDLRGQDVLVRTLQNAIKTDRIANAFMMTGIRGVGKTTTARIIARALNCTRGENPDKPTLSPCGECEQCLAIRDSRHPDVLEMDAASHTGVELATRQNRYRNLANFRGGENEFDVRRRLFQRFKQRIKGVAREHVHFVNDKYFKASA